MGQKLLLHEKVEVRQLEEGLRGSWYSGVVVGVSNSCRDVEYDELLCETGSSKLIESIPVTESIEGFYHRPCVKSNYRGRIRPRPPLSQSCAVNQKLSFGVCVDVLFKEAWWEGVIFDYDEGATERRVFFPDEGDERRFKLTDLRVTLEWDEFSGIWKERGVWMLVNLVKEHKKDGHLLQFIKRVWAQLKVHYGFIKMISEWTCGAYSVWKEYFREVVDLTAELRPNPVILTPKIQVMRNRRRKFKRSKASVLTRSMHKRKEKVLSLAVRTRRMCMADIENPVVSAASQSSHLASAQCKQNQMMVADACITTRVSRPGEDGKHDQARTVCCGLISERVPVKEGIHHNRTVQNDSFSPTSPLILKNSLKMSQNSNFRSTWRLVENKLTPRKVKPFKIYRSKLDKHSGIGSQITRQVDDGIPSQVQEFGTGGRKKMLILRSQNRGGFAMRLPNIRLRRRIRISKRRMPKKRISSRIKSIPRKIEKSHAKPTLSLREGLEASQSLPKEKDLFDSQCQGAPPVAASCEECKPEDAPNSPKKLRVKRGKCYDSVCFVCQYGGECLHCDHCMSSYHLNCIDLKEVPVGESFCPCCRCGLCGLNYSICDTQLFTQPCYQCGRQYHVDCLNKAGMSVSEDAFTDKFCSKSCFEICARLHELLQISNPTTREGLTWTITRSRRNDCNVHNERVHPLVPVYQVLNVFHECFEPILEPHTGRDLVADIVYNSGSKFRRLDFHGFYVIALVKGEEPVCVATIRIHGQKVAEMPLIATRFEYRRKGMCRLLVDELEKMLVEMGVERLVLPAIAQLTNTWVSSFGFTEIPTPLRKELLGYPFVVFQGTTMFQKILSRSVLADTPQSPQNLNTVARLAQEIEAGDDRNGRRFNIHYKRRRRPEVPDKGKKAMDRPDRSQSSCKFVYKRRRIQASRDAFDNL